MNDRKRETLEEIMVQYCAPGTTIYHDGWKAYGSIKYGRYQMDHQENLYENNRGDLVRTRKNQCYIESLWGDLKHRCKKIYNMIPGEDGNIESFLNEMMWRRLLKKVPSEKRDSFLISSWILYHSKIDRFLFL